MYVGYEFMHHVDATEIACIKIIIIILKLKCNLDLSLLKCS